MSRTYHLTDDYPNPARDRPLAGQNGHPLSRWFWRMRFALYKLMNPHNLSPIRLVSKSGLSARWDLESLTPYQISEVSRQIMERARESRFDASRYAIPLVVSSADVSPLGYESVLLPVR